MLLLLFDFSFSIVFRDRRIDSSQAIGNTILQRSSTGCDELKLRIIDPDHFFFVLLDHPPICARGPEGGTMTIQQR